MANRDANSSSAAKQTKVSYWDRPKPIKDWHWFLGRLGSTLIVAGLLTFLFVGYQLWGTGIQAAQSQHRLGNAFSDISIGGETPQVPTEPVMVSEGDPVALIEIPAIGIKQYVVAGVDPTDLRKGPGHYPDTPFPGELGNSAIAGHRTTYGEPFRDLDKLVVGDPIVVTDLIGRNFTFRVTKLQIVGPKDSWVVDTVDRTVAMLTLTTCHPEFSAKQRLVVSARLDTTTSDAASTRAAVYSSATAPAPIPGETGQGSGLTADVFDKGWFSDSRAFPEVAAWVALEIAVVAGAWFVARRLRNRAIGLAVGVAPFFVVLYFVFENVNRLLPPNL